MLYDRQALYCFALNLTCSKRWPSISARTLLTSTMRMIDYYPGSVAKFSPNWLSCGMGGTAFVPLRQSNTLAPTSKQSCHASCPHQFIYRCGAIYITQESQKQTHSHTYTYNDKKTFGYSRQTKPHADLCTAFIWGYRPMLVAAFKSTFTTKASRAIAIVECKVRKDSTHTQAHRKKRKQMKPISKQTWLCNNNGTILQRVRLPSKRKKINKKIKTKHPTESSKKWRTYFSSVKYYHQ